MKKIATATVVIGVAAFVACNQLIPERFRVNAPIRSLLFQSSIGAPDSELIATRLQTVDGFAIGLV